MWNDPAPALPEVCRQMERAEAGPAGGDDARVKAWAELAGTRAFQAIASDAISAAAIEADDVVVDLGAGTGLLALRAAETAERVIAIDRSATMLAHLWAAAEQRGMANVETVTADIRSLPLADECASVVVSNYAFHHLDHAGKGLALAEARRILRPGGRLVIADMMFGLSLRDRDRRIIAAKIVAIGRRGPAGLWRIARNGALIATGRWEHPEPPEAWRCLLEQRRFEHIDVSLLAHESGVACARRPARATPR